MLNEHAKTTPPWYSDFQVVKAAQGHAQLQQTPSHMHYTDLRWTTETLNKL